MDRNKKMIGHIDPQFEVRKEMKRINQSHGRKDIIMDQLRFGSDFVLQFRVGLSTVFLPKMIRL